MKRRSYSRQFKMAAVKKVVEHGMSVAEVARDLEIAENLLHTWKRKFLDDGLINLSASDSIEEELKRLREENKRLKTERDILKKAAAFFANEKN